MTAQTTLTGLRVLVVEDDALIGMLMEDSLDDLGCAIVGPTATVAEATNLVESSSVDAVLLDLNLGQGQNAYAFADSLLARGIPFAFVTGQDTSALRSGYQGCATLQKPFRADTLEQLLHRLAAERRQG